MKRIEKALLNTRWRVLKVSRYINIKDAKNFEYTSHSEDAVEQKFFSLSATYPREELFSPFFLEPRR